MHPISSCVRPYKGKPAIYIDGTPFSPQIYALTDCPTANRSQDPVCAKNIRLFADRGFRLFQLDVWFEDLTAPDGSLDLSFALDQLRGIEEVCPDGAVMFRLHCNPTFEWLRKNPAEWVRFSDTETLPPPDFIPSFERYLEYDTQNYARSSFASEKWLAEMGGKLTEFCWELSKHPEANRLFSIQIANGLYGENHYWGFTEHDPDISEPMQRCFRKYLKKKYADETALQTAYGDPDITFDAVTVPCEERYHTDDGIFRDPQKSRRICDYFEAQHHAVTDSMRYFCRIIKENWPRPIITGVFYGYYISLFGRQASGGHLLEQEILNCPYIDFLSAPQAYNRSSRSMGGPGLSRGLVESVTLHGKLWLDEMDQPTHHGTDLGGMYWFDRPKSIQNNRKCVLEPFVRGGGLWYYDFGKYFCAGWWEDPEYQADIAVLTEIINRKFHQQYTSPADVLLVCDTGVFFYTGLSAEADPITGELSVEGTVINAYMSGAAASTVYLSDLPRVDLSGYRAIVFVNCFHLTAEQTEFIRTKAASDGRKLIWCTAPGYLYEDRLMPENVARTVGMELTPVRMPLLPAVHYGTAWGGITEGGSSEQNREKPVLQTFFAVTDPNAVPIAHYDDGSVACAKKGNQYFFALPPVSSELLHRIFADCGCHIYNQSGDSTLAGAGLIVIASKEGGTRTVTLKNNRQLTLSLEPCQTIVLDAASGEILL